MSQPIYRLYTILRAQAVKNMKGNRGRMVTQGGHCFVHALWDAQERFPADVEAYRAQPSAFKITLIADSGEQLHVLADRYRSICGVSVTEEKGTRADGSINDDARDLTGIGVGPVHEDLVADDIKNLKPFL